MNSISVSLASSSDILNDTTDMSYRLNVRERIASHAARHTGSAKLTRMLPPQVNADGSVAIAAATPYGAIHAFTSLHQMMELRQAGGIVLRGVPWAITGVCAARACGFCPKGGERSTRLPRPFPAVTHRPSLSALVSPVQMRLASCTGAF
jgi:hypothetical protein